KRQRYTGRAIVTCSVSFVDKDILSSSMAPLGLISANPSSCRPRSKYLRERTGWSVGDQEEERTNHRPGISLACCCCCCCCYCILLGIWTRELHCLRVASSLYSAKCK